YNWAALGYLSELEGDRDAARAHYGRAAGMNPDNRYAQEGLERVGERGPDSLPAPESGSDQPPK
ncbi:MAG: hypothetical protein OXH11_05265, partial [Candidatus Aminicenantes bacterium]|nr:hypothetical protein [Candidatus Aminicenantes bacterium]